MANEQLDRLARAMADGFSRRSVLRRAVGTAMTSPLGLVGLNAALADGKDKNKNKDKGKEKDRGNQGQAGGNCRDIGHPCEGNQACCPGLVCGTDGPGNARRCGLGTAATTEQAQTTNQTVINTTNQTVVQTNNQVCAGNCTQTNVQSAGVTATQQTVLVQDQGFFARPPTYWIDVACNFDAPRYRTVCDCVANSEPGAPLVRKIELATADICAFVISQEMRPIEVTTGDVTNTNIAGPSEANAGTGGVANADASGGTVTIGDVRGNNDIAVDASGGNASADASGGDNNVAIAGSQIDSSQAQTTELNALTMTLEGNVVPGKLTTYWVDTDAGRRPATGPALVQVADEAENAGAIIAEARICDLATPQEGYDWFGQCTTPAVDMPFSLYPAGGDSGPLSTQSTNEQGRAHFGTLAPGTYHLQPDGTNWCYAESDHVDANGDVIVENGVESRVWSFVCGGVGGS